MEHCKTESMEGVRTVISWRSRRIDRVCRSATCAETRAIVDLEDDLLALRFQWSEMLGNSAMENSPDEMARLVPGACVTGSKGLHDKMQHAASHTTTLSTWDLGALPTAPDLCRYTTREHGDVRRWYADGKRNNKLDDNDRVCHETRVLVDIVYCGLLFRSSERWVIGRVRARLSEAPSRDLRVP